MGQLKTVRPWLLGGLWAAFGLVATWLVLARQITYGPGMTPDSATYLILAERLLAGDRLGELLQIGSFPPLFPAVIALGSALGDPTRVATWINAAMFGAVVVVMVVWARQRGAPPWLAAWLGAAAALCAPLAEVAAYLWSEMLFLLLATLALAIFDRFLTHGGRRLLLLSAACAALCCLTRYMGLAVLACVSALLLASEASVPARLRRALVYNLIALAPIGLWLAMAWLKIGDPLGRLHDPAGHSAIATAEAGVSRLLYALVGPGPFDDALGEAIAPPTAAGVTRKAGWLVAIVGVGAGALWCLRRPGVWRVLAVPGCFTLVYAGVVWLGLSHRDLLPELRFFAPLHVPVLMTATLTLATLVQPTSGLSARFGYARRGVVAGLAVALGVWLVPWVDASRDRITQWRAVGGNEGYGSWRWAYSETLAYLRAAPRSVYSVMSNEPFAVCLLAERVLHDGCRVHLLRGRSDLAVVGPGWHLVWLHRPLTGGATTLASVLAADMPLRMLAVLADGIVLRHGRRAPLKGDVIAQIVEDYLTHAERPVVPLDAGERETPAAVGSPRLYLDGTGKRLTYMLEGCDVATVDSRIFLHVARAEPVPLPGWLPFDNLDFDLRYRAIPHDGGCLATAQLPDYPIDWVRTGVSDGWEVRFDPTDRVDGRASPMR